MTSGVLEQMASLKILIACEYSGRVRDAFLKKGHKVMSCDLLPTEVEGPHYQGDVRDILYDGWDMMIGHPYCTYNTLSGIRWMYHPDDTDLPAEERRRHPQYPNRMNDFLEGIDFFKTLQNAPIEKICLENSQPHGMAMDHIGKYNQVLQPWMFGHPEVKATCLWLKNLLPLVPTHVNGGDLFSEAAPEERKAVVHFMAPGVDRWKARSRTYQFIADQMAEQWS